MIRYIPDTEIDAGKEYLHLYRRDRSDVYRCTAACKDPATMGLKVKYEIESMECNPDYDW